MKEYKKRNYARKFASARPTLRLCFNTGQFVLSSKTLQLLNIDDASKVSILTQNGAIYISLSEKGEDGWKVKKQKSGTGKFSSKSLMRDILFDLTIAKNGKPSILLNINSEVKVIDGRNFFKAVKP